MHNQNRTQYKARQSDPIVADALSKKAASWNTVTKQLQLSRHEDGTAAQGKHLADNGGGTSSSSAVTTASQLPLCDKETCLKLSYKLLLVNPDPSYLWNVRRELITFTQLSTELELTKAALQRNPKAYAAWFHRKWCVRYFSMQINNNNKNNNNTDTSNSSRCSVQLLLEQELHLCAELLNADERNFHCWNYRRFVVGAMASNLCLLSLSWTSSSAHTTLEKDDGTIECINTEQSIDYSRALNGSWDAFMNALLVITSNDTTDHYHSSQFPYLCHRIGPQLTRKDSATPMGYTDTENIPSIHPNLPSKTQDPDQPTQLLELLRGEWLFTTHKIEQNFSNYSAYHYRSKLLPLWISVGVSSSSTTESNISVNTIQQFLLSEFQVVKNAIYTEPDDQSSWWYHRYLLDYCKTIAATTTASDDDRPTFIYLDVLQLEREAIQELLKAEDGQCKWGWITLHTILIRLIEISKTGLENSSNNLQLLQDEAEECLLKLMELDPDRLLRYQDMLHDLQQTKLGCV